MKRVLLYILFFLMPVSQMTAQEKELDRTVYVEYQSGDYTPFISTEGLWGYKRSDNVVIEPRFASAGAFSEGLAPVRMNDKCGYIDKGGKCVIPYRYEDASVFSEGLARVMLRGRYGYLDCSGRQVIPYRFTQAGDFIDGLAEVVADGRHMFVDKEGILYENRSEVLQNFTGFARQYVERYVNEWQRKGKYEKTAAWRQRVNENTRKTLIDSLILVAKAQFIEYSRERIKYEYTLGEYDADSEIFLVEDTYFGNLLVPVPIDEAMAFEKEFPMIVRRDTYYVNGNDLGLSEAVFVTSSGKSYRYSNKNSLEFSSLEIEYNFDHIDIPYESEAYVENLSKLTKKALVAGKSDVDQNIPETDLGNDNTFVVIIANENYQRVSPVEYARNDGILFKEYCNRTLNIPERNIRLIHDATLLNMWEQVDWLTGIAKAYKGDVKLLFYYAGHGIPDDSSKESYLLPIDGNGVKASTGYSLNRLYSALSESPSKSTFVFLDACFSGAERGGNMIASSRGVAIKAKPIRPKGNVVVFTASQGDETAHPYRDKEHGLFTYFLCRKIQDTKGAVTLGELADYLMDNVSKHSLIENSKPQTPTVYSSESLSDSWKDLTF